MIGENQGLLDFATGDRAVDETAVKLVRLRRLLEMIPAPAKRAIEGALAEGRIDADGAMELLVGGRCDERTVR